MIISKIHPWIIYNTNGNYEINKGELLAFYFRVLKVKHYTNLMWQRVIGNMTCFHIWS